MFASTLTFNPRSKATNIGYALFCGAVFGCWSEIAYWRGWKFIRKIWKSLSDSGRKVFAVSWKFIRKIWKRGSKKYPTTTSDRIKCE